MLRSKTIFVTKFCLELKVVSLAERLFFLEDLNCNNNHYLCPMKIVQKLCILIVLLTVGWLSINGNVRSNQITEFVDESSPQEQQFLCAETSPFQVTLPENLVNTSNIVYTRIFTEKTSNFSLITIQNKNAIFCTTLSFISHFKYICNYLKHSDLLFPFHFFF